MTRLAGQTRAVEHEMEALAGIVKLGLTAVFDAQHGGVATGWSPVSWGLIDELFVNLTMPFWGTHDQNWRVEHDFEELLSVRRIIRSG